MIISFLICSLVAYSADRVQPERNAMQALMEEQRELIPQADDTIPALFAIFGLSAY